MNCVGNTLRFGICATVLVASQNAFSAESSVEFGLSGQASYNDNRYLSTTDKQDV